MPTIKLGEMEIDILNREVRAGTSVVHLSGIEQSLLYLLASRSGRVVTREEILDAIWGTDFVAESNIVDRHIRTLRIKLQNDYRHRASSRRSRARVTASFHLLQRRLGRRSRSRTSDRPNSPDDRPDRWCLTHLAYS